MKNKNLYIIGGLAVSGVLAYLFFFRKNESLEQQLAQLPQSSGASSPSKGSSDNVLDSSSVSKEDTTKEEFEFYKAKYNDILSLIREVGEKIDKYERKVESKATAWRVYVPLIGKEQKKIDDYNVELRTIEQKILDLGYLMTDRGTFYKR